MYVGEDLSFVCDAVVIRILKNHETVVHLLERFPLGICVPACYPQATFGVDLHLHGVGQVRENFLRGKDVQLIALGHVRLCNAVSGAWIVSTPLLISI